MSRLRILELEAQIERKDKYILELEGDTKCIALSVHKRAVERIKLLENELMHANQQLDLTKYKE